jgi:hypothetical protein
MAAIGKGGGHLDTKAKAINYASIVFGIVLGIVTGWVIYSRTSARARELELEEERRKSTQRTSADGLRNPDDFADGAEDDAIDFLDGSDEYQDEIWDGLDDEESNVGMTEQAGRK